MTRAERESRLQELRTIAEAKVKLYNEAILDSKLPEATKLMDEITDSVNEYTNVARDMCFDDCVASGDPMMEAVKRLTFETIKADSKKEKGEPADKQKTFRIINIERQIDLLKLHKYVKDGIGKNKSWPFMIEKFNLLLTCDKAVSLGIDPTSINDSYAISQFAKDYDLGKNPASKTNLLKTLTNIVQAMIGEEYKPSSHDVNFLLSVYSKKTKRALVVACADHKGMRGYLLEICHKIVMGKSYEVEYKKATRR